MCRVISAAKYSLFGLYKLSGAARVAEARLWHAGLGFESILLFHRVTDAVPPDELTVGTARFRDVCRMLRRGFRVVPLEEVFAAAQSARPLTRRAVAVTFDDCYLDNLEAARVLKEFGFPATFFVPTAYVGTDHRFPWDAGLPRLPNLDWDDVREMAEMGFEIGSHTATHADLGKASAAEVRQEAAASKAEIERRLGRLVRWIAYPFGGPENFRPEWVPLLQAAGYDGCVSACTGFVRHGGDTFLLPRVAVPPFDSVLHLELFLSGSLEWFYNRKRDGNPHGAAVSYAPPVNRTPAAKPREPEQAVL
jgi:peptidoglycan/xylan/chitin deacetylase (PgdA/CDA1 family)